MLRGKIIYSLLMPCRQMSMYSPHFREPYYSKEELEELHKSGEIKKIGHIPFKAARNEVSTSPLYDPLLEKFINFTMRGGKKELARDLINKTLATVKRIQVEKFNNSTSEADKALIETNAMNIFHKAVENCKPLLHLKPVKRGGATYQVPVAITANRAQFLSMNWLIEAGKGEPKLSRFYVKLAHELINASQGTGKVIKRKQDLHRQCEANRAYAHYRWG